MLNMKKNGKKSLYHLGFQKPYQFYPENREQNDNWDTVELVVIHEKDKNDKPQYKKELLYPNYPNRPEFCHEELYAYQWFQAKNIENRLTRRCDPYWDDEREPTRSDTLDIDFSIEGAGCVEIEKYKESQEKRQESEASSVFKVPEMPKKPDRSKKNAQKRKPKENEHLMPPPIIQQHSGEKQNIAFGKPKSPIPGKKSVNNPRVVLSSIENTLKNKEKSKKFSNIAENATDDSLSIHKGCRSHNPKRILSYSSSNEISQSFVGNQQSDQSEEKSLNESQTSKGDTEIKSQSLDPFRNSFIKTVIEKFKIIDRLKKIDSFIFTENVKLLSKGHSLEIGDDSFFVIKSIGKGGYGTVFSAKSKKTGKIYALKQEKPPNIWEFYLCHELHQRVKDLEISPAFITIPCGIIGNNSSILVSDFSPFGTLIDISNAVRTATGRCIDEIIIFYIAKQLLSIFHHLHAAQIIHADVKPDNFLLINKIDTSPGNQKPFIQLIDFGLAIDMKLIKKMSPTFRGFNVTLQKNSCCEMKDGRLWSYHLDWFGIAGTIHALLFGEYMKVVKNKNEKWQPQTHIKRYFEKEMWENFFEALLNITDTHPNVESLKNALETHIQRKETFAKQKIEEFNTIISARK